jgi:uncharacterized protein (UPF0276 family)
LAGVGLNYQPELRDLIAAAIDQLDYLEIVPDIAWTSSVRADGTLADDDEVVAFLASVADRLPLVAHSIGLSIGSAHRFREEHVAKIAQWHDTYGFAWHSDHIGYNVVLDPDGTEYTVGVPLPVPLSAEMLDLLVWRAQAVGERVAAPFLLENNSAYVRVAGDEMTEAEFVNQLCARSGCGLLLDLHNIYVNARNGIDDLDDFLAALDLANVVELHVAGGLEYGGTYLDAHSGGVPEEVWHVAAEVIPSCPNLRGITFELLGSWYKHLGEAGVRKTLDRMHEVAA